MISSKVCVTAACLVFALSTVTMPLLAKGKNTVGGGAAPASAASSPNSANAGNQDGNQKGSGQGGGNQGGGSSEQLAGWLAAVAAQNLGAHLAKNTTLKDKCGADGGSCIFMSWKDFDAARSQGLAYREQLASIEGAVAESKRELYTFTLNYCKKAPPRPPGKINLESVTVVGISATIPSPWVPLAHLNLWLTAIGTAVTTVTGVAKALEPTYNMGASGPSGIGSDDLQANVQAGLLRDGIAVSEIPTSKSGHSGTLMQLVALREDLEHIDTDLINQDSKDLADPSKCRKHSPHEATEIKDGFDQVRSEIAKAKTALDAIFLGTSQTPPTIGPLLQLVDLADFGYYESTPPNHYVVDLQLSDSAGVSGTKQHWWGPIDQLFQITILTTYRLTRVDGTLVEVGTDAVYCQTIVRINDNAGSLLADHGFPASAGSSLSDMNVYRQNPSTGPVDGRTTPMCVAKEVIAGNVGL